MAFGVRRIDAYLINSFAPAGPRILVGKGTQFKAIGTFSDGSVADLTSSATWSVENRRILEVDNVGNAIAHLPGTTVVEATLHGIAGKSNVVVRPIALAAYFSGTLSKMDTTVRAVGTNGTDPEMCMMTYVFNQDQQMAECCGCQISQNGIRTLSLQHDLASNPLTGIAIDTGTLILVPAALSGNTSCNPWAPSAAGTGNAWSTHIQSSGTMLSATETPFSQTELSDTLPANLQGQCNYIQTLGSGRGICTCDIGN